MDIVDGNQNSAWPDGVDTFTPRQDSVNAGGPSVFRSPASLYNNLMYLLIHYQNNLGLRPMGLHATVQARLDSFLPTVNTFSFVAQQVPTTGGGGGAGFIEYDVGGVTRYVPFGLSPTSTGAESPNVAHIYANATDRNNQTGYTVEQTDVDLARIFLQADTVPHAAYIAQGTAPGVTWLEFGGGSGAQISNVAHTYANAGDRTGEVGYPVTATDITLARFFLQSDTNPQSMFIATGTVGAVVWIQVSGPTAAQQVIAFDYPSESARLAETGHPVTLTEINQGQLFTQTDTTPVRLFRATGAVGSVAWQELGPPEMPSVTFIYPTAVARVAETGYTISTIDIALRRFFAQSDTDPYSLWIPTGTPGAVVWQQIASPAVSDPIVAFIYPDETARTNQTGHSVTQTEVDNSQLFLQSDTTPYRIFVASGTIPAVTWTEIGSVESPIIAFEFPSEAARLAEAGHPVTALEISRKLLFLQTDIVPNTVYVADGTPGNVTWREICCGSGSSAQGGNLNVVFTTGNGATIQNIRAQVVPTAGGAAIQSSFSNAQGLATFTDLAVDTYNLTTVTGDLAGGATVNPTTQVTSVSNGVTTNETIDVIGAGTGTLNVTFGTTDGSTIQNIRAEVVPVGGGATIQSTFSSVSGLATFASLVAGDYNLSTVTGDLDAGDEATPVTQVVTVLSGNTVAANITITAIPSGAIDVTFGTTTGATISGIRAQVVPTAGGATTQSTFSNVGGLAQLTGLTPGSYDLTTVTGDLVGGATVTPTTQVVIVVNAITIAAAIEVVAATTGDLDVTFSTTTGATIQNLTAEVVPTGGGATTVSSASTAGGLAQITGLAPDTYNLTTTGATLDAGDAVNPTTQVVTITSSTTTNAAIEVIDATTLGALDVTFSTTTGATIQNITAELVPTGGGATITSSASSAGGLAQFTGLSAGTYDLTTTTATLDAGDVVTPITQVVTITGGATAAAGIVITDVNSVGALDVTFTTTTGATIQNLTAEVVPTGGGATITSSASTAGGLAQFTGLPAGTYDLTTTIASLDPGDTVNPTTQVVTIAGGGTAAESIEVIAAATALGGVTAGLRFWFVADDLALGTGNLNVTFVPATSQNVQGIRALLTSLNGGPTLESQPSNAGGIATFTNLVAGSYDLGLQLGDLGTGETATPLSQVVVITDGATAAATITIFADA